MEYFLAICLLATTVPLISAGSRPKLSPDYISKPHSGDNSGGQLLFQVQPQHQVISQSHQIQEIPVRAVTTSTLPQVSNYSPSLGLGIGQDQHFKISSNANIYAKPGGLQYLNRLVGRPGVESSQSYLNPYLTQAGTLRPVGSGNTLPIILTTSGGGNSGTLYEIVASPYSKFSSEAELQNAGISGQFGNIGNIPSYYSPAGTTGPTPSHQNMAETVFLSNPGLSLLTSNSAGSLGIQYNSANIPGQSSLPTITRPVITVINKPVNDVSGSYFTNIEAVQAKPGFQYAGVNDPSGFTLPYVGGGGYGLSSGDFAGIHMRPGVGSSPAQINQVPCILHIPNPVPITITSGATQVTTPTLPSIPASYIDNSPPIIGVLRPPSSSDSTEESEAVVVPADAVEPSAPSAFLKKFGPKGKSSADDIQEDNNDELSKSPHDDHTIYQGLARNGLPLIYTLLPPSASPSIMAGTGGGTTSAPSSVPTSFRSKNRNPSSSSSPPMSQRKNPFFNVNKRKHFEFYQYF